MKDDYTYLSRDPFARITYIRDLQETSDSCAWCGNKRKSGKMFYYGSMQDNGHVYFHSKPFCSKPCHDSYYN